MTTKELKEIEAELKKKGYKKFTCNLTSNESYAWFKTFKETNKHGDIVKGYQIAFRVWDFTEYKSKDSYGFDFWTSLISQNSRMDFTSNWDPFCDIDIFEKMAEEFHELISYKYDRQK